MEKPFTEMYSQRGSLLLVYESYKFSKKQLTGNGQKWCCTSKNCNVNFFTDVQTTRFIKAPDRIHNHSPTQYLARQFIANSVKRKAVDDITEKPAKMIRREILYSPAAIRSELLRDDIELEVHDVLDHLDTNNSDNEEILLINDRQKNIIIFGTRKNLIYLCSATKILMDGTFSHCTRFFHQLFTIHGIENGNYIPLLFCLLPKQNAKTYSGLFELIIQKAADIGEVFYPQTVVVDFELVILKAVREAWAGVTLVGCRFHLTQAWWRKIQNLGFTEIYKDQQSEAGNCLRWCFGLPLLAPENIEDAFIDDLMNQAPLEIHPFCDYILENYVTEDSPFPPSMWACNTMTSDRTTNACESFHAKFNDSFGNSHPNIYTFFEVIRGIQEETTIKIRSAHLPSKRCNKEYFCKQMAYYETEKHFNEGRISRNEFVKLNSRHYRKN